MVCVGHNDHIAWGFTNLGADVQDLYLETTRNPGDHEEFLAADGSWQPITRTTEIIKVHHGSNLKLTIRATRHGAALTPILPEAVTALDGRTRDVSLRWTIYDPANLHFPWLHVAQARDWPTFLAAFADLGGPAENVLYADDAGHIGYHALGRIPLRGPAPTPVLNLPADLTPADSADPGAATSSPAGAAPHDPNTLPTDLTNPTTTQVPQLSGPLSPVPLPPSPAHEWSGYIPFDRLPQAFDPVGGVLATANARVAPDDYPYPITLNWAAPYRNERIWKQLAHARNLTPADMLALQNDVYSAFDHVLAERLAYALDHATANKNPQAADLLRTFSGRMTTDSPAATLVAAVHATLWPMLLDSQHPNLANLYNWGEKDYALEQVLQHTPARWLPPTYKSWDDFLAAAVARALADSHAPADLTRWLYGSTHTISLEHPVFAASPNLRRLYPSATGTGPRPLSGDGTTIKQVGSGRAFGPSERFTADLANLENSTLNLPMGQSSNPASPWFQDQFPTWLRGSTYPFPYLHPTATHTLLLTPKAD